MFDLGWPEMLVIAIVLIVVVGPKDLPKMLRSFGKTTTKLRAMAGDFRKQFDEALKEAELDDLKTLAEDARKLNPASEIKKALSPMEKAAQDVRAGLDAAMKPTRPAAPEPAPDEARPAEPAKTGAAAIPGAGGSAPAAKANGAAKPVASASPAESAGAAAKSTAPAKAASPKAAAKPVTKPAVKPKARAAAKARTGGSPT